MAQEFRLQDPGEGIHEAEIREIHVEAGQEVEEGDVLLTVETDKAAVEIPSPFTGAVEEIRVEPDQIVEVGEVLMTYTGPGKEEEPAGAGERESEAPADESGRAGAAEEDEEAAARDEEGAEPEEHAAEDDGEEPSPEDEGVAAGGGVAGRPVERHEEHAAAPEGEDEETGEERPAAGGGAAEHPTDRPVPAAPSTRRLARELGIEDLHEVPGSGPGGRVTEEDVRAWAGEGADEGEATATAREEAAAPRLPDFERWGPVERIPLRSVRRATAKRMATSWATIPHVTHHDVADVTGLERFLDEHAGDVEEGSLTLTVMVVKAVASALREHPRFNASLDEEAEEIVVKHYVHVGVAVDTERGLVVPVIRDADRKSVREIAAELEALVARTREGDVGPDDLRGGTFTVTNPGPIGGRFFTPIINHPQAAILGLGRAWLEPVAEGGPDEPTFRARRVLPLSLAFDHRVNDGADAARFVNTIRETLADPDTFLLSV